jgi:hypothetical protein
MGQRFQYIERSPPLIGGDFHFAPQRLIAQSAITVLSNATLVITRRSFAYYSIKLRCEIETGNKSPPSISIDRYHFRSATSKLREWGIRLGNMTMRSDDYRHPRAAFTEMALQRPDSLESARWLAIARACLDLEQNEPPQRGHQRRRNQVARDFRTAPARAAGKRGASHPAAQQGKTVGRTELPH